MVNEKYYQSENKDQQVKHTFSKYEYDLYTEDQDIQFPIVRVKHTTLPGKIDRWRIFEDNKVVLVLDGNKFTKKERSYLYTIEGVSFIISQYKLGVKSLNGLKAALKKKLKPAP